MDLNALIWETLDKTVGVPDGVKKQLHMQIMRLIENSKNPVGKRLGVTVMTEEGSLAGNKTAADRKIQGTPGDAKPKSL